MRFGISDLKDLSAADGFAAAGRRQRHSIVDFGLGIEKAEGINRRISDLFQSEIRNLQSQIGRPVTRNPCAITFYPKPYTLYPTPFFHLARHPWVLRLKRLLTSSARLRTITLANTISMHMAAADVIKGIVFEGPDLRVSLGVGEGLWPYFHRRIAQFRS